MNKLFTKIATALVGSAMAIAVGVAIAHDAKALEARAADPVTFDFTDVSAGNLTTDTGWTTTGSYTHDSNSRGISFSKSTATMSYVLDGYGVSKVSVVASTNQAGYTLKVVNGTTESEAQSLTKSNNTTYEFESPTFADGDTVTLSWNQSGAKSIMIKSITFTVTESGGGEEEPKVNEVTVAPTTLAFDMASTELTAELTATISADEGAEYTVEWTTDNDQVATVAGTAENATVTAVGVGEANIKVAAGGVEATCVVTVTDSTVPPEPKVNSIELDHTTLALDVYNNQTGTLVATVAADEGADDTVTWATSNEQVASVVDGVVTAVAAGEATITATAGDKEATCTVTVTDSTPITNDYFVKYEGEIEEGDYLIVYEGKAMNNVTANNRLQYNEVTVDNGIILNPQNHPEIAWHIGLTDTEGQYTLQNNADNKYASSTGAKNQATTVAELAEDGKTQWTIAANDDGSYRIVNVYNSTLSTPINSVLMNNGTYGFACYAGTGTGSPFLYRLTGPDMEITVADDKTTLAPEETANVSVKLLYGATGTVEFSSSDESVITVAAGENGTAVVTAVADGEAALIVRLGEDMSKRIGFTVSSAAYLDKIEVTTQPTKTVYHPGETLDLAGMVVTATYSDEGTFEVPVAQLAVGEYNFALKGEKEISLTWTDEAGTEKSTTLVVNVEYEVLSPSQAVALGTELGLANNEQSEKTYRFSGVVCAKTWSSKNNNGNLYLADTYNTDSYDKTKTFEVYAMTDAELFNSLKINSLVIVESKLTVYNSQFETTRNPEIISAETEPAHVVTGITAELAKTNYYVGDELDLSGLVVTATDNYGQQAVITEGFTTNEEEVVMSQSGTTTLTVTHTESGYTCSVSINVYEVQLTGAEIKTLPAKSEYLSNEQVDLTGLVMEESYNNGGKVEVAYSKETAELFTVEPEIVTLETTEVKVTYKGYEDTFEVTVTISPLDAAKEAAIDAVEDFFNSLDTSAYSEENRGALNEIRLDTIGAINLTTEEDIELIAVEEVLEQVRELVAEIPTIAEEEAAALAAAKEAAKEELDGYYAQFDQEAYDADGKAELATALADGKTAVDECENQDAIQLAVNGAKEAMNAVKTAAEKAAEELADAKSQAKAELDEYVAEADYRADEWAQIQEQIIAAAKSQIDEATSIEAVEGIVATAKAAIDAIPTAAEMDLDEAKAAAKTALQTAYDALVANNQYTDEQATQLADALQAGKDAVDAATTTAGVATASANAIEAMNAVPTKPATPAKKGCGGSIAATSIILSTLALAGAGLLVFKKKEEK